MSSPTKVLAIGIHAVIATVDGTPTVLMLDKDTTTASLCSKLAQQVGVQLIASEPNDSRVKGQIEAAHMLIERHFQRLLMNGKHRPTVQIKTQTNPTQGQPS